MEPPAEGLFIPYVQVLIYKALGFEQPTFGHVSLILAGDKSKLSKRCTLRNLPRHALCPSFHATCTELRFRRSALPLVAVSMLCGVYSQLTCCARATGHSL